MKIDPKGLEAALSSYGNVPLIGDNIEYIIRKHVRRLLIHHKILDGVVEADLTALLLAVCTAPTDGKAATTEPSEGEPVAWRWRVRAVRGGDWSAWRSGRPFAYSDEYAIVEEQPLYLHPAPPSAQPSKELVERMNRWVIDVDLGRPRPEVTGLKLMREAATALSQPPETDAVAAVENAVKAALHADREATARFVDRIWLECPSQDKTIIVKEIAAKLRDAGEKLFGKDHRIEAIRLRSEKDALRLAVTIDEASMVPRGRRAVANGLRCGGTIVLFGIDITWSQEDK